MIIGFLGVADGRWKVLFGNFADGIGCDEEFSRDYEEGFVSWIRMDSPLMADRQSNAKFHSSGL